MASGYSRGSSRAAEAQGAAQGDEGVAVDGRVGRDRGVVLDGPEQRLDGRLLLAGGELGPGQRDDRGEGPAAGGALGDQLRELVGGGLGLAAGEVGEAELVAGLHQRGPVGSTAEVLVVVGDRAVPALGPVVGPGGLPERQR